MTHPNELSLRFVGPQIAPDQIRARDLARILGAYEGALADLVARVTAGVRSEQVTVSLTDIRAGSLDLTFTPALDEPIYRAAYELIEALQRQEWGRLPFSVLNHVREILNFNRRYGCTAYLHVGYANEAISAVLEPDTVVPTAALLYGETQLVGEVRRVGGAEPKVEFRTVQGETLFCTTSEDLAKELGHYLYEQVEVAGVAEWNFSTSEIAEFEIRRLVAARRPKPAQAFKQLRQQFGHLFEKIDDVDAWTRQTRHG